MILRGKRSVLVDPNEALKGRETPLPVPERHFVLGRPLQPPFPATLEQAVVGLGCFWGAERKFWQLPGVYTTAAGYAGGFTRNPTYEEVCSGLTGHAEVVLVVFDPEKLSYAQLLRVFWENHDPTQGMRQGNDVGTQYRSVVFHHDEEQERIATDMRATLDESGRFPAPIVTEVAAATTFWPAEDYHREYYRNNPTQGYCRAVIAPKLGKLGLRS